MSLHFAAACFRNAAGLKKNYIVHLEFVNLCNCLSDISCKSCEVDLPCPPVKFLGDDEPGLPLRVILERTAAAWPKTWMQRLHCGLDIIRIMITAANDDDILQSAGDKEMSITLEAKIARAQERALTGIAYPSLKDSLSFLRAIPVTFRN
jgi:hypothetical protein